MEQSIIVGMTDTAAGRRALAWAADRAAERGSRLELFSVLGGVMGTVGEGAVVEATINAMTAMLEGEADALRRRGIHVETRVEKGNPVDELIAASAVFDLLVIAAKGPSADGDGRLGTHGIRVVAGANCPVAVIPDVARGGARKGIVVGVDGSASADRALEFAIAEADRTGDALSVVHTWRPLPLPLSMDAYPHGYLAEAQKLAEQVVQTALAEHAQSHPDVEIHRIVERGFPAHRIGEIARNSRMAVVGSHGRGTIARFFLGSTSQTVLQQSRAVTVVVK